MLKVKPILDRVIIKQDPAEEMMGALILPESSKDAPKQGTVVAVGPGARLMDGKRLPMQVKLGDHVVYGEFAGHDIRIDGENYVIVEENKILLIL